MTRRSLSVSLRGRLPTWVVRIRSRLKIITRAPAAAPSRRPVIAQFHRHDRGRLAVPLRADFDVGIMPEACDGQSRRPSPRGNTKMSAPVDAIPRDYNFA